MRINIVNSMGMNNLNNKLTANPKQSFFIKHKDKWETFLIAKGLNRLDADRLSGFFAALDGIESANGTSEAAKLKNNYGGMLKNGKNASYKNIYDYMEAKWGMMNSKFKNALSARTPEEYSLALGNPDNLGKSYLYYVTDKAKIGDRNWRVELMKHVNNYTKNINSYFGINNAPVYKDLDKPTLVTHILDETPEHIKLPTKEQIVVPNDAIKVQSSPLEEEIAKDIVLANQEVVAPKKLTPLDVYGLMSLADLTATNIRQEAPKIGTPITEVINRIDNQDSLLMRDLLSRIETLERRQKLGYSLGGYIGTIRPNLFFLEGDNIEEVYLRMLNLRGML